VDKLLSRRLKLGFVGGGLNSAVGRTHYSAALMDGRFSLECGVFSRDQIICAESAHEYCFDRDKGYSSVDEMITQEALDVVAVLTPTPDHYEILKALSLRKIPTICEKPLVSSLSELNTIKSTWDPTVDLFVTYNYTGYPMVREAQSIIKSGTLGGINQVMVEMPNEGFIRPPKIAGKKSGPQSWRLTDQKIPHAALDLATHALQLTRFITQQEISSANAKFSNHSKFDGVRDTLQIIGELTHGSSFSLWTTKTALGYRNGLSIRIFCERGSISWVQSDPEILHLTDSKGLILQRDRSNSTGEGRKHRYDRFKVGHPSGYIEAFANYYYDVFNVISKNSLATESSDFIFNLSDSFEELSILESLANKGIYERRI
jgi:predicted dehydrogenase